MKKLLHDLNGVMEVDSKDDAVLYRVVCDSDGAIIFNGLGLEDALAAATKLELITGEDYYPEIDE